MPVVTVDIARSPDECWRAFTDARLFAAWMPGLRRATIVATGEDGLATEVQFEFSTSLVYSLSYRYDLANREVHWAPRTGTRDAVRGYARIVPHAGGARITYMLEQGVARTSGDLVLGGAHPILDAFVRWIERRG